MLTSELEKIIHAVLYEGYILYPYRASSPKNQRERFTFGQVHPKDYADWQNGAEPCICQTECLVRLKSPIATIAVTIRFLHPMLRETGSVTEAELLSFESMRELPDCCQQSQSWQEATEREVTASITLGDAGHANEILTPFFFCGSRTYETLTEFTVAQRWQDALDGLFELRAKPVGEDIYKLTIRVTNQTPVTVEQCDNKMAVMMRTFASTHTILQASGAEFLSMIDPPAELRALSGQCKNIGTWPVLVGDESRGEKSTLLSSPIILHDYPQIAPEKPGPFFDGAETGQTPALRVLTMTGGERIEMRQGNGQAPRLLENSDRTFPLSRLASAHI